MNLSIITTQDKNLTFRFYDVNSKGSKIPSGIWNVSSKCCSWVTWKTSFAVFEAVGPMSTSLIRVYV